MTVFESFYQDSAVQEAQKILLNKYSEYQSQLTKVRPAQEDLKLEYEKLLEDFAKNRGGKLWYPYLGSGMGNGPLVELCDGSVKYDMICGIGPHYFGHGHKKVLEASLRAALSDVVNQGNLQQNKESAELVSLLSKASGFDHCFLSNTGVMACENAMKIIFQKKSPANRMLAFEKCFMGRTLAMSWATDKPQYRSGLPNTLLVDYVPFYDEKDPEGSTKKAVKVLRKHLSRYPGQHAAMAFELIQGEGGFYPGTHEFFSALMTILKEHDVAVLVDEVQSFGRSSRLFAFQHFGLEKFVDLVSIGKLSQVCATLYNSEFKPKPGLLSQTFTGSTSSIFTAIATLSHLLEDDYYGEDGKIVKMHESFSKQFESLEKKHGKDLVCGPYGLGAMFAFTVFSGDAEKTLAFSHFLFEKGIIAFVAGANPMRIRFLLPIPCLSDEHIEDIVKLLEQSLIEFAENCSSKQV